MKMQQFFKIILVLFIAMVVGINTTMAQEWSAKQQEVWKAVENWWVLEANNDVEGIKALFHQDYMGWNWGNNAPDGQTEALRWASHMIPKGKIAYTNLKPLDILVMGDPGSPLHTLSYRLRPIHGIYFKLSTFYI